MDKIETMKAFVAVAQEGSFTKAGLRLGFSTKLVSKYVQHLETHLRAQLFNRTTRSVAITDAGAAYLEKCLPILDQIDELDAAVLVQQQVLAGNIRLTAPTGFGSTKLADALVLFMRQNPDVHIDLVLSDYRAAVVEEGFDLAVRIGALADSTLMARKLANMPIILVASPEYLNRHGEPIHPQALKTHECLLNDYRGDSSVWRFDVDEEELPIRLEGNLRANSPAALVRLARGGLGITRAPLYAVEEELASGTLVQVLKDFRLLPRGYGVHALYPQNRHLTIRVRALIDHLAKEFSGATWGQQRS